MTQPFDDLPEVRAHNASITLGTAIERERIASRVTHYAGKLRAVVPDKAKEIVDTQLAVILDIVFNIPEELDTTQPNDICIDCTGPYCSVCDHS